MLNNSFGDFDPNVTTVFWSIIKLGSEELKILIPSDFKKDLRARIVVCLPFSVYDLVFLSLNRWTQISSPPFELSLPITTFTQAKLSLFKPWVQRKSLFEETLKDFVSHPIAKQIASSLCKFEKDVSDMVVGSNKVHTSLISQIHCVQRCSWNRSQAVLVEDFLLRKIWIQTKRWTWCISFVRLICCTISRGKRWKINSWSALEFKRFETYKNSLCSE